jgi:hypothetical protein
VRLCFQLQPPHFEFFFKMHLTVEMTRGETAAKAAKFNGRRENKIAARALTSFDS